jgi:hypothetical protein
MQVAFFFVLFVRCAEKKDLQLKALSVGSTDDKSGAASSLDQELSEISRLQSEFERLKAELDSKKAELNEKEQKYFTDGKSLATAFLGVAKHVNMMGKGPLEGVFRALQAEYSKALGLDASSNSSDEEDEAPVTTTPSKIEKLTGSSPNVITMKPRNLRLERSDSTVGWVKPKASLCM